LPPFFFSADLARSRLAILLADVDPEVVLRVDFFASGLSAVAKYQLLGECLRCVKAYLINLGLARTATGDEDRQSEQ
jgi:hypothetical protein